MPIPLSKFSDKDITLAVEFFFAAVAVMRASLRSRCRGKNGGSYSIICVMYSAVIRICSALPIEGTPSPSCAPYMPK